MPSDVRDNGLSALVDAATPAADGSTLAPKDGGHPHADASVGLPQAGSAADSGLPVADASSAVPDVGNPGVDAAVGCGVLCLDAGSSCTPTSCTATECGQKPDGCGATLTCPKICGPGDTCTANQCVTPMSTTCAASSCPKCGSLQAACCKNSTTCGCAFLGFLGCN